MVRTIWIILNWTEQGPNVKVAMQSVAQFIVQVGVQVEQGPNVKVAMQLVVQVGVQVVVQFIVQAVGEVQVVVAVVTT